MSYGKPHTYKVKLEKALAQVISWKTEAELRYAEVGRLKVSNAELQAEVDEWRSLAQSYAERLDRRPSSEKYDGEDWLEPN